MKADKLLKVSLVCVILGLLLTVLAVTDCAAQDRPLTALRIGLVGIQVADLAVTQRALGEDGRELNRLMPTDPLPMAAVKIGGYLLTDWAIGRLAKKNKVAAYVTTAALVAFYAAVVVHNERQIR